MPVETDSSWLDEQIVLYSSAREAYKRYAEALEKILRAACSVYAPLAIVQVRVKSLSSFAEKAIRKSSKYNNPVRQFTDLCGGRVITQTQVEADRIAQFIRESFVIDVANSENKRELLGVSSFGYLAMHYIVQLPSSGTKDIFCFEKPREATEQGLKAEIQVKTMLQHAWATVTHDTMYKNLFSPPQEWHREMNRLAATLEETDASFARFMERLDIYAVNHGAYMPAKERESEIKTLELILRKEREEEQKPRHALRIAGIRKACEDWKAVADILAPYASEKEPVLLRELGYALCRANRTKPDGKEYGTGLGHLEQAAHSNPADAETHASLAWALRHRTGSSEAREHLAKAYELNPANPYYLNAYLESELLSHDTLDSIPLMRPTMRNAVETCRTHIEAKIEIPCAYFTAGRLSLLLNMPLQSLDFYMNGLRICLSEQGTAQTELLEEELVFLQSLVARMPCEMQPVLGNSGALLLLSMAFFLKARHSTDAEVRQCGMQSDNAAKVSENEAASKLESALSGLHRLKSEGADYRLPVLILAGSCANSEESIVDGYRKTLLDAVKDYRGVLFSGGTLYGVAKLAGDIAEKSGNPEGAILLETVAYLPRHLPISIERDLRYNRHILTEADYFSVLEPLQMWTDLLACGIEPSGVKLIGIGGGSISALEYRLALLFGAQVGIMEGSGRAADVLLDDSGWSSCPNLLRLCNDRMTVRAFLGEEDPGVEPESLEAIARIAHENYRRERLREFREKLELPETLYLIEPGVKPWESLDANLKESNRHQTAFMLQNLRQAGFIVKQDHDFNDIEFTVEEIETMAEAEHGRWNVERLASGWRYGDEKDINAKVSPYLVSWEDLSDEIKEYDREVIRNYPERIRKFGYCAVRSRA